MTVADRVLRSPSATDRLPALDQLRGALILLVVLHHAILAYCGFGHIDRRHYVLSTAPIVDAQRWAGFDLVVLLNDGFFMPLLFLLSGLFVWGSLARRGPAAFLRGRLLRLGVPLLVAKLTLIPLAYYPSFLQAGGAPGFAAFWAATVTEGPWPSGPPWFIGVLLAFDAAVALVFLRTRDRVRPRFPASPVAAFGLVLAVSVSLYLPLLLLFGRDRWLSVGPLAVQGSRALFYAGYFAAGVALGACGIAAVQRFGAALARWWTGWCGLMILAAVGVVAAMAAHVTMVLTGVALAAYCAAACFAWSAVFLRFGGRPGPIGRSLVANSFAIYLLHYPAVTWTQYALLPLRIGAIGKAAVTYTIAVAASWTAAVLLRLLPGVRRVL